MSNDISDISAIEYAATQQTIDVTVMTEMLNLSEQELKELHQFHFWLKTQRQARLAECPVLQDPDEIEDGKTLGSIIGGIIGIGLSFIIPGIGLATGLAIGASIGGLAGAALQRPEDESKKAERRSRPSYGITSNKALVKLGDPVPLIFTNRDRNPNGGVRLTGQLICSWIDTFKGVQKLYEQYVLSIGEIGAVDVGQTLLDGQELDNFLQNEVVITTRPGTQSQGAMTNFPFYAQTLSPQLNTQLGLDLRSIVEEVRVQRKQTIADINWRQNIVVLRTETNCNIEKNGGPNGFITTRDAIRAGKSGFVQAQVLRTNRRQAIAITNVAGTPGTNPDVLPFVFSLQTDGTYTVRVNNVAVTTTQSYARNDIFTIEYLGNQVVFRRNGTAVHTSTAAKVYPARLAVYILDTTTPSVTDSDGTRINDLRVGNDISYNRGGTKPGQGSVIELKAPKYDEDEDLSNDELLEMARNETDQFNPGETYFVNGQDFRITNKNWNAATVTADRVLTLAEGNQIFCRWTPNIETSKKINEVHVNLVARLFARDDKNKLVKHGVCFDCFVRTSKTPWVFVFRGLIANSSEGEIRRYFKLKNLPLDKYKIELRPLRSVDSARTIYRLGDTGGRDNQASPAVIAGRTLQFESQIEGTATAAETNKIIRFNEEDKPVVSSQQGAPIAITSINEVVMPRDGQPPRYLGFAVAGVEYLASERIQTAPTPNFLMQRGIVTRAHLAAGTVVSAPNGTTMIDNSANFLGQIAPIAVGDTVRNLDRKLESLITAADATTITAATSLQWQVGDRYLIYRRESINYFPDVYAFVLGDPDAGLGAQIDRDEWLDYPSFVAARQFCVRDEYFWDGTISDLVQWRQWAAAEAIASRLLPCRINGRFGLLPEQETPIAWLFNASNVKNYKEEWIDWSQAACNSLVVSYTDTRDDFRTKTVRIQTPEAALSLEPIREKNLQLPSVTTRTQAIRAGSVAFKSPRIQTRSISFTTGLQGCYLKPGDLIQGQHITTEWNFERSGVVEESLRFSPGEGWSGFPPFTGTQEVMLSINAIDFNRPDTTYRAAVQYKDTGEVSTNLRCEISMNNVQGRRTIKIRNLVRPLALKDTVILGEDLEDRRTYRVASVRPTEEGSIEVIAIYWSRDILTLDGITIDGVCINGFAPYSFDRTELTGWLNGSNTYLGTYTRDTLPSIANSNNLLVNSFHEIPLRGNWLPGTAGTAEGQFAIMRACAMAHKATGSIDWLSRSLAFGAAAVGFFYRGVGVPSDPAAANWIPHWLWSVKGSTLTKGFPNPDTQQMGHFNISVTFTNGIGIIPWGIPQPDYRPFVSDIYSVRSVLTNPTLNWRNVYAAVVSAPSVAPPAQNAIEKAIEYWTATINGAGQIYRFYPNSAANNGRLIIPTPNGESAGRIVLLDKTFTAQALVTYGSFTGTTAARNEPIDNFPMWRPALSGEIVCHLASLPWAHEAYSLLEEINPLNTTWRQAKAATAQAYSNSTALSNPSWYWKKSDAADPLAFPGTAIVQTNNSNGFTLSRVTTNANGRQNWVQLTVPATAQANPSIEMRQELYQSVFEVDRSDVGVSIEIAHSLANQMVELYFETVFSLLGFSNPYRLYFLSSATANANTTRQFRIGDFINWNTSTDFVWHPTAINGGATVPLTSSTAGTGTVSITPVEQSIEGYHALCYRINMSLGATPASAAAAVFFTLTGGAPTNNPPSIYFRTTSPSSALINYFVADNQGAFFPIQLPNTEGKWQRFTPVWDDFAITGSPITTAPITQIAIAPAANGTQPVEVFVYFLAVNADVQPLRATVNFVTPRTGIRSRLSSAHTISVGDFRPTPIDITTISENAGNTAQQIPYLPGIVPFSINQLNGSIRGWQGNFYVGYQSPFLWLKIGDRDRLESVLSFLKEAQDNYAMDGSRGDRGGFAPIFLGSLLESAEFLSIARGRSANYFVWSRQSSPSNHFSEALPDPNITWAGYWSRAVLEVAKVYNLEPGNRTAEDILRDAFKLANSLYFSLGNRYPTTFRESGTPIADYHEPGVAAQIMQAAILANIAGLDPIVSFPPIRNSYEYLRSQYVATGVNAGSFTADQPTFGASGHRENFGYWVAAEIEAIACLLINVENLKQPC